LEGAKTRPRPPFNAPRRTSRSNYMLEVPADDVGRQHLKFWVTFITHDDVRYAANRFYSDDTPDLRISRRSGAGSDQIVDLYGNVLRSK